jgi:Flp pilus assembly pilin Flp
LAPHAGTTVALRPGQNPREDEMKRFKNESGQSLVEYMILLALVVLVCVSSTKLLGKKINTKFNEIKSQIDESIPVRLSP